MTNAAKSIRLAVAQRAGVGPRFRYPSQLRERALQHVRGRLAAGVALDDVAAELALSPVTLRRWMGRPRSPAPFRRVEVVAAEQQVATGAGLVVHGPLGLRIEVRDVAALAELLRRLG